MDRREALKVIGALALSACAPAAPTSEASTPTPIVIGGQARTPEPSIPSKTPEQSKNNIYKSEGRRVAELILTGNYDAIAMEFAESDAARIRNDRINFNVFKQLVDSFSFCRSSVIKGVEVRDFVIETQAIALFQAPCQSDSFGGVSNGVLMYFKTVNGKIRLDRFGKW